MLEHSYAVLRITLEVKKKHSFYHVSGQAKKQINNRRPYITLLKRIGLMLSLMEFWVQQGLNRSY